MPARRVVIQPEAEQDIAEARDWYEGRTQGLGRRFVQAIEKCIHMVQGNPRLCEVVLEDFRRASLERFPYVVFYEFSEDTIVIHGVFHCARDPGAWRRRLRP